MDKFRELVELARSGEIVPLMFVIALREVPGYSIKDAPQIEAQIFNSRGFPVAE